MTGRAQLDCWMRGSLIAVAFGVIAGVALRPTPAESTQPATPQLVILKPDQVAGFDPLALRRPG